jgi:hypothetical protein
MSAGNIAALQLHGTGTALGDPIEVNASLSVLLADGRKQQQQQVGRPGPTLGWEVLASGVAEAPPSGIAAAALDLPLQLLAAKSIVGHAEPAAGLTGVLYAVHQLRHASAAPILHLHTLNPHVTAAISSVEGAGTRLAMPREVLPLVGATAALSVGVGVSAFAFQGTNAHAIISAVDSVPCQPNVVGSGASAEPSWEKQRLWVHPKLSALVCSAAVLGGPGAGASVMFQCRLSAAALASWWDHRVGGKAVVPGAGFLELGARCAHLLQLPLHAKSTAGSGGDVSPVVLALMHVSIPSPCFLPDVSSNKDETEHVNLICSISPQGDLKVVSNTGYMLQKASPHVHLLAQIGATRFPPEAAEVPPAVTAAAAQSACGVLQKIPGWARVSAAAGQPQGDGAVAVADVLAGRDVGQANTFPAQLDAALQLSAVTLGWLQPKLMDILQVPAAAEAYISTGSSMDSADLVAAVAIKPGFDHKLMEVDVSMATGVGLGGAVAKLKGLQARSAGTAMVMQVPRRVTAMDGIKEVGGSEGLAEGGSYIPSYLVKADLTEVGLVALISAKSAQVYAAMRKSNGIPTGKQRAFVIAAKGGLPWNQKLQDLANAVGCWVTYACKSLSIGVFHCFLQL